MKKDRHGRVIRRWKGTSPSRCAVCGVTDGKTREGLYDLTILVQKDEHGEEEIVVAAFCDEHRKEAERFSAEAGDPPGICEPVERSIEDVDAEVDAETAKSTTGFVPQEKKVAPEVEVFFVKVTDGLFDLFFDVEDDLGIDGRPDREALARVFADEKAQRLSVETMLADLLKRKSKEIEDLRKMVVALEGRLEEIEKAIARLEVTT